MATQLVYKSNVIRDLMNREGLTLQEFARKAGIPKALIGAWVSGAVTPTLKSVGKLCAAFDVEPNLFFETQNGPRHGRDKVKV